MQVGQSGHLPDVDVNKGLGISVTHLVANWATGSKVQRGVPACYSFHYFLSFFLTEINNGLSYLRWIGDGNAVMTPVTPLLKLPCGGFVISI